MKTKYEKMGTIEPIYKTKEENDNSAFIRGVIEKYRNSDVDKDKIFDYILTQL